MEVKIISSVALSGLKSDEKIYKILDLVKKGDLVVIEGRLTSEEELKITSKALEQVSGRFTGIEIAFLGPKKTSFVEKLKNKIISALNGNVSGITVVGPSKIIKDIKMDPNNLNILLK